MRYVREGLTLGGMVWCRTMAGSAAVFTVQGLTLAGLLSTYTVRALSWEVVPPTVLGSSSPSHHLQGCPETHLPGDSLSG